MKSDYQLISEAYQTEVPGRGKPFIDRIVQQLIKLGWKARGSREPDSGVAVKVSDDHNVFLHFNFSTTDNQIHFQAGAEREEGKYTVDHYLDAGKETGGEYVSPVDATLEQNIIEISQDILSQALPEPPTPEDVKHDLEIERQEDMTD